MATGTFEAPSGTLGGGSLLCGSGTGVRFGVRRGDSGKKQEAAPFVSRGLQRRDSRSGSVGAVYVQGQWV